MLRVPGKMAFRFGGLGVELYKLETALTDLGEVLESVCDERYIAQKTQALRKAGIVHERVEIESEDFSIN